MNERLTSRDLALLALESSTSPTHNATIEIFDPGDSGFDHASLIGLIEDRISFVPRYRQRIQSVPGRLANPVWVDDENFDLNYHVRRSALPRPGSLEQLRDLVARIVSRPLDRDRPLWEVYFVEGLAGGQVALLSKSHQVLVDGIHTVDLGQVLLDDNPATKGLGGDAWHPRPQASPAELVLEAVRDSLDPGTLWQTTTSNAAWLLRDVQAATGAAARWAQRLSGRRTVPESPIHGTLSRQRRVVVIRTDLEPYRQVSRAHQVTVNDVILATITGGLRAWLMARQETLGGLRQLRTLVPVSVLDQDLEATSLGSQIAPHFVELPVGETSAVMRLHQISYAFQAHQADGRAVSADRLAAIAGFAPTTFHAIGSRLAAAEVGRGFQLSITNVPGPQVPMYTAGAQMVATYPVHPLLPGHALAIGVTSYDGGVYFGLTADRELLPDADLLGVCLTESLDELLETVTDPLPGARR